MNNYREMNWSTKIRPKKKYTTNRKDLDGAGVIDDVLGPTKIVSDLTGKVIGGPTKNVLDDWWSGALAKRAFSPKLLMKMVMLLI